MKTTEIKKSNDLRYSANKVKGEVSYHIKIRLNDECHNGHQDFSITGSMYEVGKPAIDRYSLGGGAIGDTIAKEFPEFAIFNRLHLCDYTGVPMHAVSNGFNYIKNGFDNAPIESPKFIPAYCEYYRLTYEQFDVLSTCNNEIQYGLKLEELGIIKQWGEEAKEAIKLMEQLTGMEFVVDSIRTQYDKPTPKEVEEEANKVNEGYYTPEAQAKRDEEAAQKSMNELEADVNKDIEKLRMELIVKKEVFKKGGKKALDNCIFYNHSQELAFNWMNYGNLSSEFLNELIPRLVLPNGVKVIKKA